MVCKSYSIFSSSFMLGLTFALLLFYLIYIYEKPFTVINKIFIFNLTKSSIRSLEKNFETDIQNII